MRVLIAEDDPVSRRMLEATLLKWNYEVIVAKNGREAMEAFNDGSHPKLAILDWMMPELSGVDVCKSIREIDKEPYTYIILLTARGRKEDVVHGIEAGADDYITKPFNIHELDVRLRAGKRIVELQEQLIEAREAMRLAATQDFLTGVANRASIFETFKRELTRAKREIKPLSIIMADLDHFKSINDTYGHATGDDVLRSSAKVLSSVLRPYDAIGRYGGEEFLIVLPGCRNDMAVNIAERLCHLLNKSPMTTSSGDLEVTCSMGVATLDVEENQYRIDDLEMNHILIIADTALYKAKSDGRNCVRSLSV